MLKAAGIVLILLIPTLAAAALLGGLRVWRALARRIRTHRAAPVGMPLETVAAELRRLHRQLVRLEDAADMTPGRGLRVKAMRAAYGDSLLAACRALDVTDAPADATRLTTAEIYRLESALRDRGLDIRPAALH